MYANVRHENHAEIRFKDPADAKLACDEVERVRGEEIRVCLLSGDDEAAHFKRVIDAMKNKRKSGGGRRGGRGGGRRGGRGGKRFKRRSVAPPLSRLHHHGSEIPRCTRQEHQHGYPKAMLMDEATREEETTSICIGPGRAASKVPWGTPRGPLSTGAGLKTVCVGPRRVVAPRDWGIPLQLLSAF